MAYHRTVADIDIRLAAQVRRREQALGVEDLDVALDATAVIDALLDERLAAGGSWRWADG